jgi:EpsI family protein
MIGAPNEVYDGKVWQYAARGAVTVPLPGGPFTVIETRLHTDGGAQRVVWHWYRVGGRDLASPLQAKLLGAAAALGFTARDSAVIALSAPLDTTNGVPAAALTEILARRGEIPGASGAGDCGP